MSLLYVLSGSDFSLEYMGLILGVDLRRSEIERPEEVEIIHNADHMFTRLSAQERLLRLVQSWILERVNR